MVNNGIIYSFGYCGDKLYAQKSITLPISYNNLKVVLASTKNTSNAVCNRVSIKDNSTLSFNRSGDTNVTGWYLCIGN